MDYRAIAEKNQILKVRVGSHLFGTDTPESDTDYEGIFMPSAEMVFGFGKCREVDFGVVDKDETGRNTAEAVDYKVREFRDFCRLALENNPNILNILFSNKENTIYSDDYAFKLRTMRHKFPHKGCIPRYKGYAQSQMKKMKIKPGNYKDLCKAEELLAIADPKEILVNVVGALRTMEKPFIDLGPGKHIKIGDIFLERGLKVSRALSTIRGRIERASARSKNWEQFGYDTKFASNLIQILMQGKELVETGNLTFPLKYASLILDIKSGMVSAEDIIEMADVIAEQIGELEPDSPLISKPRYAEIEEFVIRETIRWFNDGQGVNEDIVCKSLGHRWIKIPDTGASKEFTILEECGRCGAK